MRSWVLSSELRAEEREREREEKKNNGSINSSTSLDAAFYKISRKDPVPELFEFLFIVTLLNVSDEAISRVTAHRQRDGIRVQVFPSKRKFWALATAETKVKQPNFVLHRFPPLRAKVTE
jgi:hypothetical protein